MKKNLFIIWFWSIFGIVVLAPVITYFAIHPGFFTGLIKEIISSPVHANQYINPEIIEKRNAMALNLFPFLIIIPVFLFWFIGIFIQGIGAVIITRTAKGQKTFDKGWEHEAVNYGIGIDLIKK